MRTRSAAAILLLFSLCAVHLFGAALPSLAQIKKVMLSDDEATKAVLARDLGMRNPGRGQICLKFTSAEVNGVGAKSAPQVALLLRSLDRCWYDYLVVLSQSSPGLSPIKAIPIFSHYRHSRVSFPAIFKSGEKVVWIDEDTIDSGTGAWDINSVILRVDDRRVWATLDEPKIVNRSVPDFTETDQNTEEFAVSEFTFVPVTEAASAFDSDWLSKTPVNFVIAERRSLRKHSTKLTLYRLYDWDETLGKYRATAIERSTYNLLVKRSH